MSYPTRKRKEFRQPKKLTDFFIMLKIQDGGSGSPHKPATAYTGLPDADGLEISAQNDSLGASPSSLPSSASNSPAESRMRLDSASTSPEVSPASDHNSIHPSPIAVFPTSNQPVLDTTMKDMLISLQSSLRNDISTMFNKFSSQMHYMGQRVCNIETQVGEMTETVNDLVDAHDHTHEEQQ